VTLGSADGYATATDGNLYQEPGGWSTLIGTTGCNVAPVFANGVVYAAGCNSIGAYEAGSGAAIWSISIPQEPSGLAIANGVLYVCWGSRLRAYYASFGVLIGTIGLCTGPAEIAMGTVYTTDSSLFAYTLTGVFTSVWRPLRAPDPALLELNSPTLPRGAVRVGGLAQQR
jgi:hypothetical protein